MNEMKPDFTTRNYKYVGTRPVRPDGVPKVTGALQASSSGSGVVSTA